MSGISFITRGDILEWPTESLVLSVRLRHYLKKMGCSTIGKILRWTERDFLARKNFGKHTMEELNAILRKNGLRLPQ